VDEKKETYWLSQGWRPYLRARAQNVLHVSDISFRVTMRILGSTLRSWSIPQLLINALLLMHILIDAMYNSYISNVGPVAQKV
jgi:hypothetical protein